MNSKPTQQKELAHQKSSKPETKMSQKERKIRKMTEKIKKRNLNIENHHDLEASHKKIIKHSFHNLKYWKMLNFKNNLNFHYQSPSF